MSAGFELKVAGTAGFCFGVRRAVNLAEEAPQKYPGLKIRTLGPIIHNPQVVTQLAEIGVAQVNSIDELDSGVVIVRSHGITRQLTQQLQEQPSLTIIDATCPFVRRAQEIVAQMSADGYLVIIIGEPEHPEVTGLISYGRPETTLVISRPEDLPADLINNTKLSPRIALLAQTTQSQQVYHEVISALLARKGELRCFNTICTATSDRQSEALRLAESCDLMLVIGGRNSANTNRLFALCREKQSSSYHIETASDLHPEWFKDKRIIGISAGASTPQWLIDEVCQKLKTMF
ncbi:MAG: 4-hydroxy-3-methylbut-2-enyl diphosphate reductase [Deltaproteobacteria bacterium]|nr:4-hydroxy-3-methylbut-2-enyl diphosphate reductase [Deltaproteobacteria bacterium]